MNEMPMAMSTNKISSSTLLAVGFATSPAAQTACGSKEVSNSNTDYDDAVQNALPLVNKIAEYLI